MISSRVSMLNQGSFHVKSLPHLIPPKAKFFEFIRFLTYHSPQILVRGGSDSILPARKRTLNFDSEFKIFFTWIAPILK
jgi:hypothetical protein